MKSINYLGGLGAFLLTAVSAGTVCAQTTNDAVSEINGQIGYSLGRAGQFAESLADGSLTFPVTHRIGFQVDATYTRLLNQLELSEYGVGAHLFWRDPQIGLLGVTGSYSEPASGPLAINYSVDYGVEGAYYFHRFTFGFFGGANTTSFIFEPMTGSQEPSYFLGRLSVDYYPWDDLRVGAAYIKSSIAGIESELHNFSGHAEYQTPIPGLALNAELTANNRGNTSWSMGLRFYFDTRHFGDKKSLIARHRQDN